MIKNKESAMFTLTLVIAFCSLVSAQSYKTSLDGVRNTEYALDFISSYDMNVKFPYFEDFRQAKPELAPVVTGFVTDVLSYLNTTLTDMLVGKNAGKIGTFASLGIAGQLAGMAYSFYSKRKKIGLESGTSPNFNIKVSALFRQILYNSQALAKEMEKKKAKSKLKDNSEERLEFEERKNRLLGTIVEALNSKDNKVSMYWNWNSGIIRDLRNDENEVSFEREVTDVFANAIYYGYGSVVARFQNLMDLFLIWSKKGWK